MDDVDICKQGDLPHICDFGDNGKPRCLLGLHQDFHSGSAQTLKIVGRGSGLKCAAPEHVGAGVLNRPGGAEHLLVCFHGTGAGNQAERPAANLNARRFQSDDHILGMGVSTVPVASLRRLLHRLHKFQIRQQVGVYPARGFRQLQDGAALVNTNAGISALVLQPAVEPLDLRLGSAGF